MSDLPSEDRRQTSDKGFTLDDDRLKGWDQIGDHFDELLARIREIRASEKRVFPWTEARILNRNLLHALPESLDPPPPILAFLTTWRHFYTHGVCPFFVPCFGQK